MTDKEELPIDDSDVDSRLDALTEAVAELREGQDELLRMYQELRVLYPMHCLCTDSRAEAARREFLREDVFRNSTEHEEYRPS